MPRIQAIDPERAEGRTKELFAAAQRKLGKVPNLVRTLAHSPAALQAYLTFGEALESSSLPAALREQIALTVSEANGCGYCLAAHCAIGKKAGLSDAELLNAREMSASDHRIQAALHFARRIVDQRGLLSDDDVAEVRQAGYGDAEITDVVATVVWMIFSNYFNHVAGTEVDFAEVP